ncbi:hypothetical protein BD413DRAFT_552723 [Trametes elegans]|nr:hypothetical protein BD413DRAFT_552723 [Trametes elegans]
MQPGSYTAGPHRLTLTDVARTGPARDGGVCGLCASHRTFREDRAELGLTADKVELACDGGGSHPPKMHTAFGRGAVEDAGGRVSSVGAQARDVRMRPGEGVRERRRELGGAFSLIHRPRPRVSGGRRILAPRPAMYGRIPPPARTARRRLVYSASQKAPSLVP